MATIALTSLRRVPRRAPTPMPMRRVLGAYVAEARFETLRHLKAPAFALPFLILPVVLYLFFGVVALGAGRHRRIRPSHADLPVHRVRGRWA